jgi:uncharacterized membrane protein YoaT (DUF817 family)
MFGLKQGWASLFGGAMLALLFGTSLIWPPHALIARYDFLAVAALAVQVAMLGLKLESLEEAKVIFVFHIVGTVMEVFKTHVGSWVYPEPSLLRIGGVPLFSGFMYACVGSYIARVQRIFRMRFSNYPPTWSAWLLAAGIYANFFLDHWKIDLRWGLFAFAAVIFWRTWTCFTPDRVQRRMPFLLSGVLVSVFIWLAENLGTFSRTWIYPSQAHAWSPVHIQKVGSWFLLAIISFVLVSLVHRPERSPAPVLQPAQ